MMKIGEKIKLLRRQKNLSQEVLANALGVTFQAVSKWETGTAMPDVMLIPAIASFFGVSTDELFDFNVYTVEKNVEAIVAEHSKYWENDKAKCEQILWDGLKKYPGNDILLNCLIGVLPVPERSAEVIDLCKLLIEGTRYDEVRYDACRILAVAYRSIGETSLAREAIEKIPELYFTKLGIAAELLEGEEMFAPAVRQKSISFEDVIRMCMLLAGYYRDRGESEKARIQLEMAKNIILASKEDFATPYTYALYETFSDRLQEIGEQLAAL